MGMLKGLSSAFVLTSIKLMDLQKIDLKGAVTITAAGADTLTFSLKIEESRRQAAVTAVASHW